MKYFVIFCALVNCEVLALAAPNTVGEVAIKAIEGATKSKELEVAIKAIEEATKSKDFTNNIYIDWIQKKCSFYEKLTPNNECVSTEWGTLMIYVVNIIVCSLIIQFLTWIFRNCFCSGKFKKSQDIESGTVTKEEYEKVLQELIDCKKKKEEAEKINVELLQEIADLIEDC